MNDAFELGLKYDGPGIDVNIALFRQHFKDFQLNTFNGINFEVENVNSCSRLDVADGDTDVIPRPAPASATAAGVRSEGIEFEMFTRPFRNATFNFGMTYANARTGIFGRHSGEPLSPALFQLPDRMISNASELVTTASFSWTPPIGSSGMRGLFYIDGRQMSDFNTGSDLDIEKRQKGFGVVNGRIGLHGPDDVGASSCGRRTCSTPSTSRSRSTRRSRAVGRRTPRLLQLANYNPGARRSCSARSLVSRAPTA